MERNNIKALLIEDDEVDFLNARKLLAGGGYPRVDLERVSFFQHGLQRLAKEEFDVVLLDFSLPDTVNLEAISSLKKAAPATPIILLTGNDSEETALAAMQLGAQDYLIKRQVDRPQLMRAIRYAMERKTLEESRRVAVSQAATAAAAARTIEALRDGLALVSRERQVVSVNPSLTLLTGYEQAELAGLNIDSLAERLLTPESLLRLKHEFRRLFDPASCGSAALELIHKDGRRIPVSVSVSGIDRDAAGEPAIYIVMLRDISDLKRVEDELRRSYAKLETTLEQTVQLLSTVVEIRDPYTAGHQRRVQALACGIAREMGLGEERIQGLRLAGAIHDIGKIAVPAEILSKPGKLTAAEFMMIRVHPSVAYDLLKPIDFPWPVADIVAQHHEMLDGSGYPKGLKGDAILIEALILAVADVVEAMATHRPYRPARGVGLALEEILRYRGDKFLPEAVDACVIVVGEGALLEEEPAVMQ